MRQINNASDFALSQNKYDRCKMLIASGDEQDLLKLLKATCIMSVWSPNYPSIISLEGPWHCIGRD